MAIKREWKLNLKDDRFDKYHLFWVFTSYGRKCVSFNYPIKSFDTYEEAEEYVENKYSYPHDFVIMKYRHYELRQKVIADKGTPKKKYAVFQGYSWVDYSGVIEAYDRRHALAKTPSNSKVYTLKKNGKFFRPKIVKDYLKGCTTITFFEKEVDCEVEKIPLLDLFPKEYMKKDKDNQDKDNKGKDNLSKDEIKRIGKKIFGD